MSKPTFVVCPPMPAASRPHIFDAPRVLLVRGTPRRSSSARTGTGRSSGRSPVSLDESMKGIRNNGNVTTEKQEYSA